MATLPGPEQLYGDFHSKRLDTIIAEFLADLPDSDLPSEGILDTALIFIRGLFYCLGPEHKYRWEGDLRGGQEAADAAGVHITNRWPIAGEFYEKRPCVLTMLSGRSFMGLHQDQMKHNNIEHGVLTKSDLVRGNLNIVAVSRLPVIARRLVEWIGINFRLLAQHLTFAHRFHDISSRIGFTEVEPAGDLISGNPQKDYYRAAAIIPYTWGWMGRVTPKDPLRVQGARFDVISYGVPVLDGSSDPGGIVDDDDLDSFEQSIYEQAEG